MRLLQPQDAAWLLIESADRPMNVGGVALLEPPAGAAPTWARDALVNRMLEFTDVQPPLNRRLRRPHGRLGLFEWEDVDVDLTHHVRHLALPAPGRIREMLSLVAQLHSPLLDRHRPLWEVYVIEGIADGRVAVYTKFHHSLMDGVSAMAQMLAPLSRSPDDRDLPPPWAVPRQRGSAQDGSGGGDPLSRLAAIAGGTGRTARSLLGQAMSSLRVTRAFGEQLTAAVRTEHEVMPFQAPPSMLNVPLTAARRFVAQSYDLARLKAVAKAAGVTLNDVTLAMCGGALRAYLEWQQALPDRPLVALVPVDIRSGQGHEGNALSLLLANLGTHVADPLDRLSLIHESMDSGKQRLRRMNPAARQNYGLALAAPLVLGQLTGMSTRLPPLYNVIVSNLPGPTEPLYLNGARLDGTYPVGLVADGLALNITQTSYAGQMEFGLLADRDALPRMQRLIDDLEDALAGLERALGV